MRVPIIFCFIILMFSGQVVSVWAGASKTNKGIVIGLQPNEKNLDLESFKKLLSQEIGREVSILVPSTYSDLLHQFKEGKVDFAFFSALSFIEAEKSGMTKVLLKKVYDKDEFYYSAIITLSKNRINKIEDLKGKTMGFVDVKSTSGYLYPRVLLRRAGLESGIENLSGTNVVPHKFFGTHAATVQALLDGKIDAVGVWANDPKKGGGIWTSDEFKGKAQRIKVIAYSDPIPNDAFVVRTDFFNKEPQTTIAVMHAMIALADSGALKRIFDIKKMATARSPHYDSVREAVNLLELKSEP